MPFDPKTLNNNGLHALLLNGFKPFRYRAGVRILLGLPDTLESPLFFLPNLPPVGFRYAETAPQVSPDEVTGSGVSDERPSFTPKNGTSPRQKKPYPINTAHVSETPALEYGAPVFSPPFLGTNTSHPGEPGLKMSMPPHTLAPHGSPSAGIDIPGKTESGGRFPAITPFQKDGSFRSSHGEETEPSAGHQPQKPTIGALEISSTLSSTRVDERAFFPQKTSNDEPSSKRSTGVKSFEGLDSHPKKASGMTYARASFTPIREMDHRDLLISRKVIFDAVPPQPVSQTFPRRVPVFVASREGRISSILENEATGSPRGGSTRAAMPTESLVRRFQGSNQAVEAHIQQLRQPCQQTLKIEDKGRPAAPPPPVPAPSASVLYPRQPAPQSATPPAFLERSYLSRTFFRLRMFR